jgi:hypothetical protein
MNFVLSSEVKGGRPEDEPATCTGDRGACGVRAEEASSWASGPASGRDER